MYYIIQRSDKKSAPSKIHNIQLVEIQHEESSATTSWLNSVKGDRFKYITLAMPRTNFKLFEEDLINLEKFKSLTIL